MSYTENLWVFFLLLFGIVIIPGLDMLFVMTNALARGRRAAFAATGGIMAGGVLNNTIAAAGISVLLQTAPRAFAGLILAGALYMAWIGLSLVRSSVVVDRVEGDGHASWTAFRQGVVTNLLNPKAHLFLVAVLPQFIKPDYGPLWRQALVIIVMTAATQFVVYGAVALMADRGRSLLLSQPHVTTWVARAVGVLFLATAVMTLAQFFLSRA